MRTELTAHGGSRRGAAPRRITVVRFDRVGDFVLTTPLLRELRRAHPLAHISLVVHADVLDLAAPCPHVDRVRAIAAARPSSPRERQALGRQMFVRGLAAGLWSRADWVIQPRWDVDEFAAAAWVAGTLGRRRVAYAPEVTALKRRVPVWPVWAYNDLVDPGPGLHEAERGLHLLRHLGVTPTETRCELWMDDLDRARAAALLAPLGGAPFVALGVDASHPRRVWPLDRFVQAGMDYHGASLGAVVLLGGAAAPAPAQQPHMLDLRGKTTWRISAAICSRARLVLANDSGLAHVAAAVGTPTVVVSPHPRGASPQHPSAPERFHPWGVTHAVVRPRAVHADCRDGCGASQPHCILDVDCEAVARAMRRVETVAASAS